MYSAGYVRILPLSSLFEGPENLPLTFSADQFRERLPPEVLRWMRNRALLAPIKVRDGVVLGFAPTKRLRPTNHIHVQFDPGDPGQGQSFQLFDPRVESLDESGKVPWGSRNPRLPRRLRNSIFG